MYVYVYFVALISTEHPFNHPRVDFNFKMAEVETLSIKRNFHCPKAMVFSLLTETHYIQGYTRSRAESRPVSGGAYSLFDGSITGSYEKVDEAAGEITLKWRMRTWAEHASSTVRISISSSGSFGARHLSCGASMTLSLPLQVATLRS